MDNNSNKTIEIKDIVAHFKNYYSCLTVEAIPDQTSQTKSNAGPEAVSSFSKIGCLSETNRIILKPHEKNRVIGVLSIFPKNLDVNS